MSSSEPATEGREAKVVSSQDPLVIGSAEDETPLGAEGLVQLPVLDEPLDTETAAEPPQSSRAVTEGFRPDEVHLWRFDLDKAWSEESAGLLTGDELERAARFRFLLHQRRFVAGRAVVRRILGRYLDEDPRQLKLSYGPQGKPALRSASDLVFNLSHSENLALLAVGGFGLLGVDVERIHFIPEMEAIAYQMFSDREASEVLASSGSLRAVKFFQCWTRKEAFVKALGGGLSIGLADFEVSLASRPKVLSVHGDPWEADEWGMKQVVPAEGYVAAVAARHASIVLRCFDWSASEGTEPGKVHGGEAGRIGDDASAHGETSALPVVAGASGSGDAWRDDSALVNEDTRERNAFSLRET